MKNAQQFDGVVELARRLVSIPSVNPQLADDASVSGESRLFAFLEDFLSVRGFAVSRHEKTGGRPNLVAVHGPDAPRRRLMIEAHMDTQGVHGMTVPPFDAEIRDGRLYGRGACDMKGPMAAALVTLTPERLERLAEAGVQLVFAGAIGEETGNIGAHELADHGLGADELLVLEPTEQHIVHAHKGVCWFEIELNGVAAHGSNPAAGRSAIRGAALLIEELYVKTADLPHASDLLGRPTVNVGIINGGTSVNIVPERCIIKCDRRSLPGEDGEAIMEEMRGMIDRLAADGVIKGGAVREITVGAPFETSADSGLVKRLSAACDANGVKPVTEGASWYSDAGPLSKTCREVAVFGPGSIRQAHTADEFIEIEALRRGEAIIASFLDKTAEEVAAS